MEDVETETHRDSKIWRMSRLKPSETHQKVSRPRVSLLNVLTNNETKTEILIKKDKDGVISCLGHLKTIDYRLTEVKIIIRYS